MKRLTTVAAAVLLSFTSLALWAEPVDINSASAPELAAYLKGVGPAKAEAIVSYRQEHGPFPDRMALTRVPGIGPGIVEDNSDLLHFGPEAAPAGEMAEEMADVEDPTGSVDEALETVTEEATAQ